MIFGASILLAKYIQPTEDLEYLSEKFTDVLTPKNFRSDEFLVFLYYKVSTCGTGT